jgi:hypothetical protein
LAGELIGWRARIALTVEAGYRGEAVGGFQWDSSSWDSAAAWSGLEPTFLAIDASEVAGVTIGRGRRAGSERHRTGVATVELVWTNPEGHWLFKPAPPLTLGQELRLLASVDGGAPIPLYRGSIRSVKDQWDPDGPYRITANLVDRFADLASVDLPEQAVVGLGDTTSQRLSRINALAGISAYYERFEAAVVEHSSSNFARNLLDEAQVTVEGESGHYYVSRDGFYVFRGRDWMLDDARSATPRLVWTNALGDPSSAHPVNFGGGQSLDALVNQVSMARAGGTAYTVTDSDSVIAFGLRTYQRFDLTVRYDAAVTEAADRVLEELHERTNILDALEGEVDPRSVTAAITALLDVELGDAHEVIWEDGSGAPFVEIYHVQGIKHRITSDRWRVGVDLWHYSGTTAPPTGSVWGTAVWSVSQWN